MKYRNRLPDRPEWALWLRYGAVAGWSIIFFIGFASHPSGQHRPPFMEHGLTMLLLGLCVAGLGVSLFFARFGPHEKPEARAVFMSKFGGLWFMGGGLVLVFAGISKLLR